MMLLLIFVDSGHQLLVISLSVIGGIFGVLILVSLASFISYMTCCLKKKRKERKEKSSQSEKEPFLRNHTGNKCLMLFLQETV